MHGVVDAMHSFIHSFMGVVGSSIRSAGVHAYIQSDAWNPYSISKPFDSTRLDSTRLDSAHHRERRRRRWRARASTTRTRGTRTRTWRRRIRGRSSTRIHPRCGRRGKGRKRRRRCVIRGERDESTATRTSSTTNDAKDGEGDERASERLTETIDR